MVLAACASVLPWMPGPDIAPAGKIGAVGHCGETSRIEVAQAYCLLRKTVEMGCPHGHGGAIEEIVVAVRICNDDDDVHGNLLYRILTDRYLW